MLSSLFLIALQTDLSTPEKTVRTAASLISKQDFTGFLACIEGKPAADKETVSMLKEVLKGVELQIISVSSKVTGNTATLVVNEKLTAPQRQTVTETETVKLKKTGAEWRLVVPPDAGKGVFSAVTYMSVKGGKDIFEAAKRAAEKTAALSNAKQLATSVMIFTTDHDDKFPKQKDWKKAILPYCKKEELFHAPGLPKDSYSSFSFNTNLAGVSGSQVMNPSKTIMIYLGKNGRLEFPYAGKTIIAFADSSAKALTKEEAAKLSWKP